MKKIVIMSVLLLNIALLSACNASTENKESATQQDEIIEVKEENTTETDKQNSSINITKDELKELWIDVIASQIYDDNYLGNITYNIVPDMNEDTLAAIKGFTATVYDGSYDSALETEQEKISELKTYIQGQSADIYFEKLSSMRNTQSEWVKELREIETKEQALFLKEKIDNGSQQYSEDSTLLGMAMRNAISESNLDYTEDEQTELLKGILMGAMEKFGDPVDVGTIKNK